MLRGAIRTFENAPVVGQDILKYSGDHEGFSREPVPPRMKTEMKQPGVRRAVHRYLHEESKNVRYRNGKDQGRAQREEET